MIKGIHAIALYALVGLTCWPFLGFTYLLVGIVALVCIPVVIGIRVVDFIAQLYEQVTET